MDSNAAILVIHCVTHMSARALIFSKMTCNVQLRGMLGKTRRGAAELLKAKHAG